MACSDLRRVHLSSEEGSHLLLHSQRFASQYRAKMAFRDISVKALERAIAQDASEQMAKTLGTEVYQWLHSLSRVYLRSCRKFASKPDQDMTKQVDQIYQLLASAKSCINKKAHLPKQMGSLARPEGHAQWSVINRRSR